MNKLIEKIQNPMMKLADKFNSNLFLSVLRDSFFVIMPVIIFGSIVTIIGSFPFLDAIIGKEPATYWKELLAPISNATLNSLALFVSIAIGYNFAKVKRSDSLYCAIVCIVAFFILAPWFSGQLVAVDADGNQTGEIIAKSITAITTNQLGSKGIFVGIFSSFFASALFCYLTKKNLTIKMPAQVPPAVAKSFASLIPAVITLALFVAFRICFSFTPWQNLFDFVYEIIQTPLTSLGSGVIPTAIVVFLTQTLWFFGLHGTALMGSVFEGTIWIPNAMENAAAFNQGLDLPNLVTKPFIDNFVVGIGGTGCTLAIIIVIMMVARSKQIKGITKLALGPGLFNVNEPFIFGLPVILNPMILIPWILIPIINFLVAYFAMDLGLVPYTTGVMLPWTTPIFISGFLSTNSWQGSVLQLVQLGLNIILWMPFILSIDRRLCKQESTDRAATILNKITAATKAKRIEKEEKIEKAEEKVAKAEEKVAKVAEKVAKAEEKTSKSTKGKASKAEKKVAKAEEKVTKAKENVEKVKEDEK